MHFEPTRYEPTRPEILTQYLETFTERDETHARHINKSIADPARPLARHLVMIPVAAHQESAQIKPAIAQYAKQLTEQPFTLILGLNSPLTEAENPAIDSTMAEVEAARNAYPNLDIRTAMTFYVAPTIGMVRRDLWNGALLTALDEGAYITEDKEVIGINHDIDVISISPRYIRRVQDHYDTLEPAKAEFTPSPLPLGSTNIKHAPSLDHPNVSKGVYWTDFMHRQIGASYEAGLVIPLSHYAQNGGFSVDSRTHETRPFLAEHPIAIKGTNIETSPRRYIDRLKYGYSKIWTEESFGPNDVCRTLQDTADISHNQLEEIIMSNSHLRMNMVSIAIVSTNRYLQEHTPASETQSQVEAKTEHELLLRNLETIVDKKIKLASEVLRRIVKSDTAANEVASMQTNKDFRSAVLKNYYYFYEN